jgi:RNA 3'-terminal phosphate cyclase
MGARIDYQVKKHGLFPDVVGETQFTIRALSEKLKPIDLTSRGALKSIEIYVSATDDEFYDFYKNVFRNQLEDMLKEKFIPSSEIKFIDEENPISKPSKSKA